jgi:integrase
MQGAVASRRHWLKQLRAYCLWLVAAGHLDADPFAGLRVVGKQRVGKPQLRIGEAQLFTDTALAAFEEGQDFALAPLLGLMMGLRASEVCGLTVRDVDDLGSVLWVAASGGKSANATRRLKVPAKLRPYLIRLTADQAASKRLFGRRSRQSLWVLVRQLCARAGVPVVCAHSLRGLWATLAVESGQACEAVAAALGHGSFMVTAKHYASGTAVHSAQTDRVGAAMFRNHSATPSRE